MIAAVFSVRHDGGLRSRTRVVARVDQLLHRRGRQTDARVGGAVVDQQFVALAHPAAGEDDVGHLPDELVHLPRFEHVVPTSSNQPEGVVEKSVLGGEWYFQQTVIDMDTSATYSVIGDNAFFGGLLGQSTILPVNNGPNDNRFIRHGGLIPAPLQSLTN